MLETQKVTAVTLEKAKKQAAVIGCSSYATVNSIGAIPTYFFDYFWINISYINFTNKSKHTTENQSTIIQQEKHIQRILSSHVYRH